MSGSTLVASQKKAGLIQVIIRANDLAGLEKKIEAVVSLGRYWTHMQAVPDDSHKFSLLLAWDSGRRHRWTFVQDVSISDCESFQWPILVHDHEPEQKGSTVIMNRSFCIPLSSTSYMRVKIGGRRIDRGDRL